jgi:hypothetical protein
MHLEFLVEDSSGRILLERIIPKIIGEQGQPHTWRLIGYKGIGHLPRNLHTSQDPAKRQLLDQLRRILRGYAKTPGIDAVVIVLDTDNRDCRKFLDELRTVLTTCNPTPRTLFRLAIEELEAWYLGDRQALEIAYPKAKSSILDRYVQDSVCGTWETLANAIHPGGAAKILESGWPLPGQVKCEWATRIGPWMDPERNQSPSFAKLRDGLRRLVDSGC